jgi:hypothetical protein
VILKKHPPRKRRRTHVATLAFVAVIAGAAVSGCGSTSTTSASTSKSL